MNTFTYTESILKGVRDYQSVIKGTVVDRKEEILPDGSVKSKFISARQVTITDPILVAFARQNFNNTDEYRVTITAMRPAHSLRKIRSGTITKSLLI